MQATHWGLPRLTVPSLEPSDYSQHVPASPSSLSSSFVPSFEFTPEFHDGFASPPSAVSSAPGPSSPLRQSYGSTNFLTKLWLWITEHPGSSAIRWTTGGGYLVIEDEMRLTEEVATRLYKQGSANSLYRQLNLYGWRRVNPGHVREAGDEQLPTGVKVSPLSRPVADGQIWRHDWLVQHSPIEELNRVRRHAPPKKRSSRLSVEPPGLATSSVSSSPVSASPGSSLTPWSNSPMQPGPSSLPPTNLISCSAPPPQWTFARATSPPGFYAHSMPRGFDFTRAAEAFEYVIAQRDDEQRAEQQRIDERLRFSRRY